eukprot:scaffold1499_cov255-Pinguiococcus_pyrenoidosus.AAC.23
MVKGDSGLVSVLGRSGSACRYSSSDRRGAGRSSHGSGRCRHCALPLPARLGRRRITDGPKESRSSDLFAPVSQNGVDVVTGHWPDDPILRRLIAMSSHC